MVRHGQEIIAEEKDARVGKKAYQAKKSEKIIRFDIFSPFLWYT